MDRRVRSAHRNITPDEVQEAIYTRPRYRDTEDNLELIYGTTMSGRYLFVVVSEAIDGRDFIVTADRHRKATLPRERRMSHGKVQT